MSITNFINEINNNGLRFNSEVIPDGELHRFHVEGDKPNTVNGWYVFFTGEIESGAYGCWKRNISNTWCGKTTSKLSAKERKALLHNIKQSQIKRDAEKARINDIAAQRALDIYLNKAKPVTFNSYLDAKKVKAHDCQMIGDTLVIPLIKGDKVTSLQYISPNGDKKFLYGGQVKGAALPIGEPTNPALIAEGYATGAILHELTGLITFVCFTSGNLFAIAEMVSRDYEIIICADNDHQNEKNAGIDAANYAVEHLGCRAIAPPPINGVSDFNDLYCHTLIQTNNKQLAAQAVMCCMGKVLNG